jgi:hypothetical protein
MWCLGERPPLIDLLPQKTKGRLGAALQFAVMRRIAYITMTFAPICARE